MPKDELLKVLEDEEYYSHLKVLPDGRICGVQRMLFTTGLFVGLSEIGYEYRYCYPDIESAVGALNTWDGQDHPSGPWIKRKGLGDDLKNPSNEVEPQRS